MANGQSPEMTKPRTLAGLRIFIQCRWVWMRIITRKIDMMGLIYGHTANRSSRVYEDLFLVKDLGGMHHCCLFQLLKSLVNTATPVTTGAFW